MFGASAYRSGDVWLHLTWGRVEPDVRRRSGPWVLSFMDRVLTASTGHWTNLTVFPHEALGLVFEHMFD